MTESSEAMEIFDSISDRNLAGMSSSFVIVACLGGRRARWTANFSIVSISGVGDFIAPFVYLLSFGDPGGNRTVGTNGDCCAMKDEKTMKSGQ